MRHAYFHELDQLLEPGDLLVVNTSATRAGAVDARVKVDAHLKVDPYPRGDTEFREVVVHFSTVLDDGSWVVEVRTAPDAAAPIRDLLPGSELLLGDGGRLVLMTPEPAGQGAGTRLWRTQPLPPGRIGRLLTTHGRPIRYGYLHGRWPATDYQTVFARPDSAGNAPPDTGEPGAGELAGIEMASAEMPSAGRPFSAELVTRLAGRGVLVAPITLHAGVSSAESGEPPAAERFRVPARTAELVNWTRRTGGRVIAVGTTVTRALESALDDEGDDARDDEVDDTRDGARDGARDDAGTEHAGPEHVVRAAEGWTELVLGPDRPARVVDGLITGLHDPDASHLLLLEAVAGGPLVQRVYDAAVDRRYLWHEFGDSCLILR